MKNKCPWYFVSYNINTETKHGFGSTSVRLYKVPNNRNLRMIEAEIELAKGHPKGSVIITFYRPLIG